MNAFSVCAAATVVSAAVFSGERDLGSYSFEQYKLEFGVSADVNNVDVQKTFSENLKLIQEHNANPDKGFFLTVTKFTHLTNEQFRSVTKGRNGPMFTGLSEPAHIEAGSIPDRMDWREHGGVVSPVKNQGSCGSCWAFSAAETLESHLALAVGEPALVLSPQQLVSCSPNPEHCGGTGGCQGSTQPLAFNYTESAGITLDKYYPYSASTGSCKESEILPVAINAGYSTLKVNDYTALMGAVATKGPIAISIAAGGVAFQSYGGGVVSNCDDFVMDHAVQLVGYGTDGGTDYWLVRNSWGSSWGEGGYIRVARYGEGKEPCGTDKSPQDGDACEGDTAPRTYCGECGILSASSFPTGMKKVAAKPTHYGKPGSCMSDEDEVSVPSSWSTQPQDATVCAVSCASDSDCSADVPFGAAATPHCSLQGGSYCGLKCGRDSGCPEGALCVKSGHFSLTGNCAFGTVPVVV